MNSGTQQASHLLRWFVAYSTHGGMKQMADQAISDPAAGAAAPKLRVAPLETNTSLQSLAYEAIKKAIMEMDIYSHSGPIRLDERQLSQDLGVSRTPIRGAMTVLEQEGFVRTVPRRGIFVVRKKKEEVVEMITVWAALESMAARLATQRASDKDIGALRRMFVEFEKEAPVEHMHEYSEANIAFHQAIIRLGGCRLIVDLTANLFLHMQAIRTSTIRQRDRATKSIREHMAIIEALEQRDAELAERLVREHSLDLAAHVEKYADF